MPRKNQVSDDLDSPDMGKLPVRKKPGPTVSARKRAARNDFKSKTLPAIDQLMEEARKARDDLRELHRERDRLKKQVEERKRLLETAPSVKDQHKLLSGLFEDEGLDPVKELIRLSKSDSGLAPRDRAMILKELVAYRISKPKSVDTQKDQEMSVSVTAMSFRDATQNHLAEMEHAEELTDKDYEEFILKDDK